MASFGTKASISKFFLLSGLVLASASLFLHPTDPEEFLVTAFVSPRATFAVMYGVVQTVAFWISAGLMVAGVLGMLLVVIERWKAKQFFSRVDKPLDADGEENWMFL